MKRRRKKFMFTLVLAVILFVLINTVSFFALSTDFGLVPVYDGTTQIGWPMVIYSVGEQDGRHESYPAAAVVDAIFALGLAAVIRHGGRLIQKALRV